MAAKEATARVKIDQHLKEAGWRFFDDENGAANIRLESNTKITSQELGGMDENFEETTNGYINFLLLDSKGFPFIVLEAKSEDKNLLVGKEQARRYARSENCRFVILSNGNLHYFWDLERGNPYLITTFPKPTSVLDYAKIEPNPTKLVEEEIDDDYIAATLIDWKEEEKLSRIIEHAEIAKNDYNISPSHYIYTRLRRNLPAHREDRCETERH